MNNLTHYVKVYDNVFDKEFCKNIIETFDTLTSVNSPHIRKSEYDWAQDYRSFLEIDITRDAAFKEFINPYYSKIKQIYDHYKSVVKEDFLPNKYALENGRMKKYEANNYDQFGWHTDVGDKPSSERYLVMFAYLNDVEEGGETEFKSNIDFKIQPKHGRMVVFPPMWMFPHRGVKPISGPKYILSTYLHYV